MNKRGYSGSVNQNDSSRNSIPNLNKIDVTCRKFEHKDLPVKNLNSRLGPPGFFVHKGQTQLEEQMTILTVSNGYQEPLEVKDQFASLMGLMGSKDYPLKELKQNLDFTLNQIAWLKSSNEQMETNVVPANLPPFPQQITVPENQRDQFFVKLANSTPINQLLPQGIPHGHRGESLLKHLVTHQVPLLKATWYIKVVQQNNQSKQPQYNRNIEDWTGTILAFLQGFIRAKSKTQNSHEKEDTIQKFNYLAKLIHWNFNEGLINKYLFFTQLLNLFKDAMVMEEVFSYCLIIFPYIQPICQNRSFLEILLSSCLRKLEKITSNNQNLASGLANKSYSMLCNIIRYIMVTFPKEIFHHTNDINQYVQLNPSNNNPLKNSLEPKGFAKILQKSGGNSKLCSYTLCENISSLMKNHYSLVLQKSNIFQSFLHFRHDETLSLVKRLDSILSYDMIDSTFKDILSPGSLNKDTILVICEWAITQYRKGHIWRISSAYSLLRKFDLHFRSKLPNNQNINTQPPLQGVLFHFLNTYIPQEREEFIRIVNFYAELMRLKIFSHDFFCRELIILGSLSGSTNKSNLMRRYLYHLPVHQSSMPLNHDVNQRRILLKPYISLNSAIEERFIDEIKGIIKTEIERLGEPFFAPQKEFTLFKSLNFILSPSFDKDDVIQKIRSITELIEALPAYYSEAIMQWLFDNIIQQYPTLKDGFNREQFQFIFLLFEKAKKYHLIAQLSMWFFDNTKGYEWEIAILLKLHLQSFSCIAPDLTLPEIQKKLFSKVEDLSLKPAARENLAQTSDILFFLKNHQTKQRNEAHNDIIKIDSIPKSSAEPPAFPELLSVNNGAPSWQSLMKAVQKSLVFGSSLCSINTMMKASLSQLTKNIRNATSQEVLYYASFWIELQKHCNAPHHDQVYLKLLKDELIDQLRQTNDDQITDSDQDFHDTLLLFTLKLVETGYLKFDHLLLKLLQPLQSEVLPQLIAHGKNATSSVSNSNSGGGNKKTGRITKLLISLLINLLLGLFHSVSALKNPLISATVSDDKIITSRKQQSPLVVMKSIVFIYHVEYYYHQQPSTPTTISILSDPVIRSLLFNHPTASLLQQLNIPTISSSQHSQSTPSSSQQQQQSSIPITQQKRLLYIIYKGVDTIEELNVKNVETVAPNQLFNILKSTNIWNFSISQGFINLLLSEWSALEATPNFPYSSLPNIKQLKYQYLSNLFFYYLSFSIHYNQEDDGDVKMKIEDHRNQNNNNNNNNNSNNNISDDNQQSMHNLSTYIQNGVKESMLFSIDSHEVKAEFLNSLSSYLSAPTLIFAFTPLRTYFTDRSPFPSFSYSNTQTTHDSHISDNSTFTDVEEDKIEIHHDELQFQQSILAMAIPALESENSKARLQFLTSLLHQFQFFLKQYTILTCKPLTRSNNSNLNINITHSHSPDSKKIVHFQGKKLLSLQYALIFRLKLLSSLLSVKRDHSRSSQSSNNSNLENMTQIYEEVMDMLVDLAGNYVIQTREEGEDLFFIITSLLIYIIDLFRTTLSPPSLSQSSSSSSPFALSPSLSAKLSSLIERTNTKEYIYDYQKATIQRILTYEVDMKVPSKTLRVMVNNNGSNTNMIINAWSIFEEYPSGVSATSFAGEKIPRTPLKYSHSILDYTDTKNVHKSDLENHASLENSVMNIFDNDFDDISNNNNNYPEFDSSPLRKRGYREFKDHDDAFM